MAQRTFTIEGMDKVMKALKTAPEKIRQQVNAEISASAETIARNAKDAAQDTGDMGGLAKSINSKALPDGAEVGANVFYAPYVEFGTGKKVSVPSGYEQAAAEAKSQGKRGDFIQFWDSMIAWVKRKQLVGTYSVKTRRRTDSGKKKTEQNDLAVQLAYTIAMSILKHGLKPRPFLIPAFEEEKPKLIQKIKNILKDL